MRDLRDFSDIMTTRYKQPEHMIGLLFGILANMPNAISDRKEENANG